MEAKFRKPSIRLRKKLKSASLNKRKCRRKRNKPPMKAVLKNYNQSPRKMRLIADMIRGKNLERALSELRHLPKRGGATFEKLLRSAYANARAQDSGVTLSLDTLYVKDVRVESGI